MAVKRHTMKSQQKRDMIYGSVFSVCSSLIKFSQFFLTLGKSLSAFHKATLQGTDALTFGNDRPSVDTALTKI